jgi:hypothetical protein
MKRFEMYLDTSIYGMIITVRHGLSGYPIPSLLRVDTVTNTQKYLSLYDPAIVSIEPLNQQEAKLTFASPFTGYIRFYEADVTDLLQRILDLEDDVSYIYKQLDLRVVTTRWTQMNSYHDTQIQDLTNQITELKGQIELLNNRLNSLEDE